VEINRILIRIVHFKKYIINNKNKKKLLMSIHKNKMGFKGGCQKDILYALFF
jgi:hypothetical protein